jgi:hypothetical protein
MIHKLYNDKVTIEFREASHRYKVNGEYKPGVSSVLGILNKDLTGWAVFMAIGAYTEAISPFVLNGVKMTKIALKELGEQASKAHTRKSDRGKDVGTIVHGIIAKETAYYINQGEWSFVGLENLVRIMSDSLPEDTAPEDIAAIANCLGNWWQWVQDWQVEPIESERVVYSEAFEYCGTFDILYRSRRDGKTYMADYKTSEPQKIRNSKYVVTGHKPYPEHFIQCAAYDNAYNEETGTEPDGYQIIYLPKEAKYQTFERYEVDKDRVNFLHLFRVYKWLTEIKRAK